jgi:hypothetical protein
LLSWNTLSDFERKLMKTYQWQLAKCLVAELEVFAEIDLRSPGIMDSWLAGMLHRGIPFTPSYWSGGQDPRLKMRLVRAAGQLERSGLLTRITEPSRGRTTHVIPSAELIADTLGRLGDQVDADAVVAALSRTTWGLVVAQQLGPQACRKNASVDH